MDDHAGSGTTHTTTHTANNTPPGSDQGVGLFAPLPGGSVFVGLDPHRYRGSSMAEDVARVEKELVDQINHLRQLRDAQDPGGPFHLLYQRQIEAVTADLFALQKIAPEIDRLDELAGEAHRRLRFARAEAEDPWSPVAGVAGLVGGLVLLLSLWRGASWGWFVLAVGLLGVAAAALRASIRHRRDTASAVDAAADEVRRIDAERTALLGQVGGVPPVVSHPGPPLPGGTGGALPGGTGGDGDRD